MGLLIDVDYNLLDVQQPVKQGGFSVSKVYYLTPDGFKKCLMRAQRREGQSVDPVIYCDYYLLLEKIFKLYRDYESAYDKKMLSIKDDKIESLSKKMDKMLEVSNKILGQNDKLQLTLDMTRDELSESFDATMRVCILLHFFCFKMKALLKLIVLRLISLLHCLLIRVS